MTFRPVVATSLAQPTMEGAGVHLHRVFGFEDPSLTDPFLMMDDFRNDDPRLYSQGFPWHPHRGIETITYVLEGMVEHGDSLGNTGTLGAGDVQWMTAGRGIVHSEMPQQESGQMRGFQLWLNLPAAEKMKPAGYRDIQPDEIPAITFDGGVIKLVAGELTVDGQIHQGAVTGCSTRPLYADIHLEPGQETLLPIDPELEGLLYLYAGEASLHSATGPQPLKRSAASILSEGDSVRVGAGKNGARVLLIAGKPIGEPVVQYGPFVMNSREEIEQTLRDYRDGRLTA